MKYKNKNQRTKVTLLSSRLLNPRIEGCKSDEARGNGLRFVCITVVVGFTSALLNEDNNIIFRLFLHYIVFPRHQINPRQKSHLLTCLYNTMFTCRLQNSSILVFKFIFCQRQRCIFIFHITNK